MFVIVEVERAEPVNYPHRPREKHVNARAERRSVDD
jgi:hypothetical protein